MINSLILFLQTFGIILVVVGHTGESIPYLSKWIYSYHMPLFMFISGYLLKYTNEQISKIETKEFFYKKIERLIYPYIIISSLAYLPKYLLNSFAMRKLDFTLNSYFRGLIYPWENPIIFFWFLPTLFIIFLIVICASKLNLKNNLNIKVEIILLTTMLLVIKNPISIKLFNLSGVVNYVFYFILGIYYCINQKKIDGFLKMDSLFTLFIMLIISLMNVIIDIPENKITDLIYSLSGIIFSISLGKYYLKKDMKFLNHLFGFSFTIYLLSWFPQVFTRIVMIQKLNFNWVYVLPVSTVLGIYIPYFIGKGVLKIKKKNRVAKFVAKQAGV